MQSEVQTRRNRIDPELLAQGWKVAPEGSESDLTRIDRFAAAKWNTEKCPADGALICYEEIVAVVKACAEIERTAQSIQRRIIGSVTGRVPKKWRSPHRKATVRRHKEWRH